MDMMRKIIAASLAVAMLATLVPMALADGVQPYRGWIGADSPFYSMKVNMQKLGVMLTLDNTEKLKKQMQLADERLSEAQAMALANNTGALEAALDEYETELDELNRTTEAPDINETEYANLSPLLYHHQECFYGMMNNSTTPVRIQERLWYMCNQTIKVKNGMPFYYYNNTSYFIPPGQMKLINGSKKIPPGLAKKGYMKPTPDISNGSLKWPWDEINFTDGNDTFAMPTMPAMPTMKHGNGNGNSHK